jgi:curved DNA-binding protein CbpA
LATKVLDPYKTLGVTPNAGLPAVKRAYRVELKKSHPDMVPASNGVASSRFCEILDAFAILSDPVLRAEHDRLLAEQRQAKAVARPKPEPPPTKAVAVARGAFAAVILGCWGFMAALVALLLVILVGVAVGIIK